jgi:hypothetical protein
LFCLLYESLRADRHFRPEFVLSGLEGDLQVELVVDGCLLGGPGVADDAAHARRGSDAAQTLGKGLRKQAKDEACPGATGSESRQHALVKATARDTGKPSSRTVSQAVAGDGFEPSKAKP